MQGFPPAGGVLPKEKKAEIALIVLGIAKKKFRGLGPICMCIYRNVHNMSMCPVQENVQQMWGRIQAISRGSVRISGEN